MNPQHIQRGVDLVSAEKAVMGRSAPATRTSKPLDPVDIYNAELAMLASDLGIDFGSGGVPDRPKADTGRAAARRPDTAPATPTAGFGDYLEGDEDDDDYTDEDDDDYTEEDEYDYTDEYSSVAATERGAGGADSASYYSSSYGSYYSSESSRRSDRRSRRGRRDDTDRVQDIIAQCEADLGLGGEGRHRRREVRSTAVPAVDRPSRRDRHDNGRRAVEGYFADARGDMLTATGEERERIMDAKASKLEQIGQLIQTLDEEGIDCTKVQRVNADSPMEDIDAVLNVLRLKNDRNRYSSLAEEVILGGAEIVESIFDGTRKIPVLGWRPDYTGYSTTVNTKLHRMRYETAQVVGDVVKQWQLGSAARIALELFPSFFMYPRVRAKEQSGPGLSADPRIDTRRNIAALNEADRRRDLDEVSSL